MYFEYNDIVQNLSMQSLIDVSDRFPVIRIPEDFFEELLLSLYVKRTDYQNLLLQKFK